MVHLRFSFFLLSSVLFAPLLFAQGTSSQATATCNFDSSKQIAVEYQRVTVNVDKPVFGHTIPYDKVWAPGGKPMTLFVNAPVTVDGHAIPVGAYTMFVIPDQKQWTLIISRSTDTSGRYDQHEDLVRLPMDYGELLHPESQFSIYFAHVAPDQCSMRVDLEKARAWVIFAQGR
jgi:Protein of unknown function (DUF2911)